MGKFFPPAPWSLFSESGATCSHRPPPSPTATHISDSSPRLGARRRSPAAKHSPAGPCPLGLTGKSGTADPGPQCPPPPRPSFHFPPKVRLPSALLLGTPWHDAPQAAATLHRKERGGCSPAASSSALSLSFSFDDRKSDVSLICITPSRASQCS